MTIPHDRWLIDTNVWVFGLRRNTEYPDCSELLDRIGSFSLNIPRQLLKELNVNLSEEEMGDFFRLVNEFPTSSKLIGSPHQ